MAGGGTCGADRDDTGPLAEQNVLDARRPVAARGERARARGGQPVAAALPGDHARIDLAVPGHREAGARSDRRARAPDAVASHHVSRPDGATARAEGAVHDDPGAV